MDTYSTGTLAGAGSFRCGDCGYAVALDALDEIPSCPSCGSRRFARASMFDVSAASPPTPEDESSLQWLTAVRSELDEPGHYLVYLDDDRLAVVPLTREWTRVGRSLAADVRLDDPTVSRRHALVVRQGGEVQVLDDRSLNGVFLNGERVEWTRLEDGDELVIGRYRLYFLDTTEATAPVGADAARAVA